MKTKMYFLTLLALIIHAIVKSQTPVNLAFEHNPNYVLGYANFTEEQRREFSMVDDPSVLMIQADELLTRAQKLNKEAALMRDANRERLIREADELIKQANIKKLAACEILAYNNRMEIKILKSSLIEMLGNYLPNDSTTISAKKSLLAAVRAYRMAIELREEAYAQQNIAAMLANLHAAEEKETVAMIKLVEGMKLLETETPAVMATR